MKIEFRRATLSDAKYLYDLANDPLARENSFNSNQIEWIEHLQWISNKLEDPYSYIFVFTSERKPVGIVKFDKNKETVIGVTVDPVARGRGIGSKIIKMGCTEFWESNQDDIFAYIKTSNIGSIKSFEKASFKFEAITLINGIECVILKATKNDD